ncbi:PREDICTED: rho GDP-dissociation inhibitor 1-like [Nelumbo nucifera]|uniref:Rho GDP-dissociation inhibitor 1-like n=1 Tax=Nelumbo nucifera TaxID=4432 RepID=A0A1U8Q5Y4_NELNU|nr:PREDICTED: rho GDP-dissociation inhibitor 1-like [Nelumbo nucifera]
MESGGRVEAASPSSGGSSSMVGEKQEQKQQQQQGGEMITEKTSEKVRDDEVAEEEDEEDDGVDVGFVPGPLVPLKEQLEKDKAFECFRVFCINMVVVEIGALLLVEFCFGGLIYFFFFSMVCKPEDLDDESLRRWKEKLLGCVQEDLNGQMEPEVTFHSIGIISEDCGEISTPLPVDEKQSSRVLFTLREGSQYRLKLTFIVKHNIVSGLAYSNTVWKGGIQVDQTRGMLGTFAPQREPYIHCLEEETTPTGVLARGTYLAKLKFEDDDKRCHLELNYSFEIKKRS